MAQHGAQLEHQRPPRAGQDLTRERAEALKVGRRSIALTRQPDLSNGRTIGLIVVRQFQPLVAVSSDGSVMRLNRWIGQGTVLRRNVVAHSRSPVGMPQLCASGRECLAPQRMPRVSETVGRRGNFAPFPAQPD